MCGAAAAPSAAPPRARGLRALRRLLVACVAACGCGSVYLHGRLPDYGAPPPVARRRRRVGAGAHPGRPRRRRGEREGVAACLLVNGASARVLRRLMRGASSLLKWPRSLALRPDENPRLPEWLAYHYHVLPLRYLTVAVDPASRSSPAAVLSAWRGTGLDVVLWEDPDFLPAADAKGPIRRGACDASKPEVRAAPEHPGRVVPPPRRRVLFVSPSSPRPCARTGRLSLAPSQAAAALPGPVPGRFPATEPVRK